ncbi:MAG: MlaA family lipoprotein, partial [Thermodesulfobacteriota bacterium]
MSLRWLYDRSLIALVFVTAFSLNVEALASGGESGQVGTTLASTVIYSTNGGLGEAYAGRPHKEGPPHRAWVVDENFLSEGYSEDNSAPIVSTVIYTKDAGQVMAALNDDEEAFLESDDEFDEYSDADVQRVADPLEGFNRAMFYVNDKLYFWFMRPVSLGYSKVVPEPGRVAVRRFFDNAFTPVRFVNNVLQF